MGNWEKQQEAKREVKEKERTSRETLGKYLYDLSKLTFGAMVLGVAVPWLSTDYGESYWLILSLGIIGTFSFAILGYNIIKK